MTNEERMRAMIEAWNRHDLVDAGKFFDEHIVFDTRALEVLGTEGVFFGLEQMGAYWADWLPQWSDIQAEVAWIASTGHRVVTWIDQRQVGRESGIELRSEYAWDTVWLDGKLIRVQFTTDEDEAKRRAGLAA